MFTVLVLVFFRARVALCAICTGLVSYYYFDNGCVQLMLKQPCSLSLGSFPASCQPSNILPRNAKVSVSSHS